MVRLNTRRILYNVAEFGTIAGASATVTAIGFRSMSIGKPISIEVIVAEALVGAVALGYRTWCEINDYRWYETHVRPYRIE